MSATRHVGVYGLWRHKGRLVLVRKTRGPYTGLLDLPGGTPEPGETLEQTLGRELREETGVRLSGIVAQRSFAMHVDTDSRGNGIDFHHSGWIAEVTVTGMLKRDIAEEDVADVVLAENLDADQLSPVVVEALKAFPSYAGTTLPDARLDLAHRLRTVLSCACPGSTAELRGSLAAGTADEFSDIDLLWRVPANHVGEALGAASAAIASVAPLLSFRIDRDDQLASTRRLIFARISGVPIWWRVDLEVRAEAEDIIDGPAAPPLLAWDPYESAAQNALATVKAAARGRGEQADELLRRGYERIEVPRAGTDVLGDVVGLAEAVAQERPHLRAFTDTICAEARRHLG